MTLVPVALIIALAVPALAAHECGKGPVEITVHYEKRNDCSSDYACLPEGRALKADGSYDQYGTCGNSNMVYTVWCEPTSRATRREKWSDWPECPEAGWVTNIVEGKPPCPDTCEPRCP